MLFRILCILCYSKNFRRFLFIYPFFYIYISGIYMYICIYTIHIILYIEIAHLFSDCSCIPLHAPSLSNSTFLRPWPYISFVSSVFSLAHCPLPGVCLHPASFCWLHLVLINNPRCNWAISPCYATTYIIHHYQHYPSPMLAPSFQILLLGFRINWDPLFISSQLSPKCWPLSAIVFPDSSLRLRARSQMQISRSVQLFELWAM